MSTGDRVETSADAPAKGADREANASLDGIIVPRIGDVSEAVIAREVRTGDQRIAVHSPGAGMRNPGRNRTRTGLAGEIIKEQGLDRQDSQNGVGEAQIVIS